MTTTLPTDTSPATSTATDRGRALLRAGAASGPVWAAVSLTQAATRPDFDFATQPLSMLSTGPLGWLQITNFVVGGLLVVAGAIGMRRALPHSRALAGWWALSGVGVLASGALVLDPPGTTALSWHGAGHLIAAMISFLALAVTCALLAGRFGRAGRTGAAVVSVLAAVGVVAGNAWAIAGGADGSITLAAGVIAAMLWVSATCGARAWAYRGSDVIVADEASSGV